MSDVLVVRVNMFCKAKEMENIRNYIKSQKDSRVIVLPPYCEALVVPEDCEIRVKDISGNEVKGDNMDNAIFEDCTSTLKDSKFIEKR